MALREDEESMTPDAPVATAICQINLLNHEHAVIAKHWPATLLVEGADILEMESLLFRSGTREAILHRRDGFARFLLAEDSAEFRVQDAPGPQPIRTLRYTFEG